MSEANPLDRLVIDLAPGITIIRGDCRDVLPTLTGIDAVVTDPPYGIGFGMKHTKWSANRNTVLGNWDADIPNVEFMITYAPVMVIWGGDRFGLPPTRGWLAWIKPDAPKTFTSVELAWTNQDCPARYLMHSISATNAERVGHPTQKPVRVMIWSMEQTSIREGVTVLDPYMGSGTTGVACIRTGRRFIGIEIDPTYFDIARRRLERELAQGRLELAV